MATTSDKCQPDSIDAKKTHEELASNYALQVALQTMKERCQQLQTRLSTIEEENLLLKIEKQKFIRSDNNNVSNLTEVDKLQQQIALLNRQKSQLTHHIYMVATENKHLWTRLSLLTEANESLGTRLHKISNTLNLNHSLQNNTPTETDLRAKIDVRESLEEISLKLIENMLQEKSGVENEYAEMVERQSVKDCEFDMSGDAVDCSDEEHDTLVTLMTQDLKQHIQQLSGALKSAKQQRLSLMESIRSINTKDNDRLCSKCNRKTDDEVFHDVGVVTEEMCEIKLDEPDMEVQNILERNLVCSTPADTNEAICPMCGMSFEDRDKNKEEFFEHVIYGHFVSKDDFQRDSLLSVSDDEI